MRASVPLEDRVARIEDEVRRLRDMIARPIEPPDTWGLNRKERQTLAAIAAGRGAVVSFDRVRAALYGNQARDPSCVRSHVSYLRKKVRPLGVTIRTAFGAGYWLDQESLRVIASAPQ